MIIDCFIICFLHQQEVFLQIVRMIVLSMQVSQYISQGLLCAAHLPVLEVIQSLENLHETAPDLFWLEYLRSFIIKFIPGKKVLQVAKEA